MMPTNPTPSFWQVLRLDSFFAKVEERANESLSSVNPLPSSEPLTQSEADSSEPELISEEFPSSPLSCPRSPKTIGKEEELIIEEEFEETRQEKASLKEPPLLSAASEEKGVVNKFKAVTKCPVIVAGQDYNPISTAVSAKTAVDAEQTRKDIIKEIGEIREASLDKHFIASDDIQSNESDLPSRAEIPPAGPSNASTISAEMNAEIKQFRRKILAYTTFYTLREVIAGDETPVNNKNEPVIYQKMIEKAAGNPSLSLWDIYYEELGSELGWGAYLKARIFYFFFYSLSNFIPNIIDGFVTSGIKGLRENFKDAKQLDFLASEAIHYTEDILSCIDGAMEKFANSAGEEGRLDQYKANAVQNLFSGKRKERIQKSSEKLLQLFFPEITFYNWGKDSPFAPVEWVGGKFSSLLNYPTNLLVQWILKTFIIPNVIDSAVKKAVSKAPKETYQQNGKLYEVLTHQIKKLRNELHHPKEKKTDERSLISSADSQKLATIANLLIRIFEAPEVETRANLKKYYTRIQTGSNDRLQDAMQQNIIKLGETAVAILNDKDTLDDLLLKTLKATNETLISHSNYEDIKNKCKLEEKQFHMEAKSLFNEILEQVIQEKTEADIGAASEKTEQTQTAIRDRLAEMAQAFHLSLSIMNWAARNINSHFTGGSSVEEYVGTLPPFNSFSEKALQDLMQDIREGEEEEDICQKYRITSKELNIIRLALPGEEILPEQAFYAMGDFCDRMQEFTQEMDAPTLGEKYHLSLAEQQILDRALQPLRMQALEMIRSIRAMNLKQQEHYFSYALNRELEGIKKCLSDIEHAFSESSEAPSSLASLYAPANQHLQKISRLLQKANGFISIEELQAFKEVQNKLLGELQRIDEEQKELSDLKSLVQTSGLLAKLIRTRQGDRDPSLKDFHPGMAKADIQEILQKTKLEKSLGALIDPMQTFIPPTQRKDWEKLETLIFEQVSNDSLKEEFKNAFVSWKNLDRGAQFDGRAWEVRKTEFLEKIPFHSQEKAELLLRQVQGFLSSDILNAYWHRFLQEAKKEGQNRKRKIREEKRECLERAKYLSLYLDTKFSGLQDRQSTDYADLRKQLDSIQLQILHFSHAAELLEPEKSVSTTTTLAALGAGTGALIGGSLLSWLFSPLIASSLMGLGTSYLASFFSDAAPVDAAKGGAAGFAAAAVSSVLPIPPAVTNALIGAASFGYAAKQAPKFAREYAQHYIGPRLQKILDRALTETLKPSTREALVDAVLDGLAKSR